MGDSVGVITRKGQVTIPAEMRRSLGLKEGDRVAFVLEGNVVRVIPRGAKGSVIARTAGAFKSGISLTDEELKDAIQDSIAEDVMERAKH